MHFKLDPGRITTVYNAAGEHFSSESKDQPKESIKNRYGLPEKYIFFLGNTAPKKNLQGVLKAFIEYTYMTENPTPLVIADFDRQQLEKFLETTDNTSLSNLIHVLGYVDNKDLSSIYQMADLFLYPSFRESFGIPILEAMACGTPVITSQTSAMPEISGGAAHLVDPSSPSDIARAINMILGNPAMHEDLHVKGFRRASDFSWQRSAERVNEVYAAIHSEEVVIPAMSVL